MIYTSDDVTAILQRHRQFSEAEHRRFAGIGFLLGACLIGLIWAVA